MSSDKTEEPTPRRLRKAREQGDVAVSGALVQAASLLVAVTLLPSAIRVASEVFSKQLHHALTGSPIDPWQLAAAVLSSTLPLLAAAAFTAGVVGAVQTGALFAPSRLLPKLENLDPAAGLGKLFSLERTFATLRALAIAALVAGLAWNLLRQEASSVVATQGEPLRAAALAGTLISRLLWTVVAVGFAWAALDVWVLRRGWFKRNRMSKDEVKREYRESEGNPEIKQERRRAHQEMINSASLSAVKDASVLIVNPTHIAVALRYHPEDDDAPSVIAQGEGAFAQQLIAAARAYGVPVVRDVPIAHALKELSLGDEIPEELYEAVAEILRELHAQSDTSGD